MDVTNREQRDVRPTGSASCLVGRNRPFSPATVWQERCLSEASSSLSAPEPPTKPSLHAQSPPKVVLKPMRNAASKSQRTNWNMPYAVSEASGATERGARWLNCYIEEEDSKGPLLGAAARGLIKQDMLTTNEHTHGCCVYRRLELPMISETGPDHGEAAIIKNVDAQLKALKEHEEARLRALIQTPTPSQASSGAAGESGEFLPRHQQLSTGKPKICRRIPPGPDGYVTLSLDAACADDSIITSEHRSKFWWKDNPNWQKKELQKHVRPRDHCVDYATRCAKQKVALRYPICTY